MGRVRVLDPWLPDRVYRGRSSYELRLKGVPTITLAPLSATQDEVVIAYNERIGALTAEALEQMNALYKDRRSAKEARLQLDKRERQLKRAYVILFSAAKARAAMRGRPYTLSKQEEDALVEAAAGRCQLTGIEFQLDRGAHRFGPYTPSLDRIENSKGYEAGNVRLICTAVNFALGEWGEGVFRQVAQEYVKRLPLYSEA